MCETIIYLIRHSEQLKINGEKNFDEDDQISNEKTILSVNGEKKAQELSENIELSEIDAIWSSNYVRAIATAKYIADKNNIEINIDERLGERKLGDLQKLKELGKMKKLPFTEEQLLDENLKNIDGENRAEVNDRMLKVLIEILNRYEGKKVAIVSHGAAIKFLLMNWCMLDKECKLNYNQKEIRIESPSITKLVFNKTKLIELYNLA